VTEIPESPEVIHTFTKRLVALFSAAQKASKEEEEEKGDEYLEALSALVQASLNRSFRVCLVLGGFFIRTLVRLNDGAPVLGIEFNTSEEGELWAEAAEQFLQDLANDDFDGAYNDFMYLVAEQKDDERTGLAKFINALVHVTYGLQMNDIPLDF
jgi:hypothetical protein